MAHLVRHSDQTGPTGLPARGHGGTGVRPLAGRVSTSAGDRLPIVTPTDRCTPVAPAAPRPTDDLRHTGTNLVKWLPALRASY